MKAQPLPQKFDKEAYNRLKVPRKLGEAISGWDDPEMVPASVAGHMRPDDYIIGLTHRGRARAYPVWVVDNYHVVNDVIAGDPVVIASCERCQSGVAFLAEPPGNPERRPLFRSVGFMNATLLLKDLRGGSHWVHYDGVGLDRAGAGNKLPWIPTFHMEWADWIELHPDSEVMVPPPDSRHPDARHGHGREEMFSRPGMDPNFLVTLLGPLDTAYPESEMVLGLGEPGSWIAYPLREVRREGGVVHDESEQGPIVVFAGPQPDGFSMAAYVPWIGDRALTFDRDDGAFRDRETGSSWTIEGASNDGPLVRSRLEPIRSSCVRWHAWTYFHPGTRLFRSDRKPARVGGNGHRTDTSGFQALLGELADRGHEVRVGEPLISQRRPLQSQSSLTVFVDGDRINLHRFESEATARDFDSLEGSWSGWPIKPRSHESKTRRIGRVVLESDPEERFVDPAQVVPLPWRAVAWSPLLGSVDVDEIAAAAAPPDDRADRVGFVDVIRALKIAGREVIETGFLPRGQLRVGCVNAIALTIDGDRFLLYRFESSILAEEYASQAEHAFPVGEFVVRSTPETMYQNQPNEILYANEQHIRWSLLEGDSAFRRTLQGVIEKENKVVVGSAVGTSDSTIREEQ